MATVTRLETGTKLHNVETHVIEWEDVSDTSAEIETELTKIIHYSVGIAFGSNAGHTDGDVGLLEIDEAVASDKTLTVPSSGSITVNRILTDSAGALAGQTTTLTLWGKT